MHQVESRIDCHNIWYSCLQTSSIETCCAFSGWKSRADSSINSFHACVAPIVTIRNIYFLAANVFFFFFFFFKLEKWRKRRFLYPILYRSWKLTSLIELEIEICYLNCQALLFTHDDIREISNIIVIYLFLLQYWVADEAAIAC